MTKIICDKVTIDIFLLYTKNFIQLYDGSRFITILGEYHNDMSMDLSQSADGTTNEITLTQKDYIYRDMGRNAPPTLVELEIIPGLGALVPSYNLTSVRSAMHPSFKVDDADIRRGVFHLPDKPGFWLDIILQNEIAYKLTYDECMIILKQVGDFYQYVVDDLSTPDSLKEYVRDNQIKLKKFRMLLNKHLTPDFPTIWDEKSIRSNWNKFNYYKYRDYFKNMQISVLDINILYNIYRHPMYSNIVIVCGYGHGYTLLDYFTKYVGVKVLSNIKSQDQGYKNTINLKGTYNPMTLEACIASLQSQSQEQPKLSPKI